MMISGDIIFLRFKGQTMNFLRQIISKPNAKGPEAAVAKMFNKLSLNSSEALPEYYWQVLMETSSYKFKPRQVFREILTSIPKCNSSPALVKLFTIVFVLLRKTAYPDYYLQQLEGLEDLKCSQNFLKHSDEWARQLAVCCMTYLARVSSLSQVYLRALTYKTQIIGDETMQMDLFRLINAYSLLFPLLNRATNSMGRYFKHESLFFTQFYRTMRSQISLGYTYMKYICNRFMTLYQSIDLSIITSFNTIICELQLLGDEIEQFLLNKYYKQKSMGAKLYFKEEAIQELTFYLKKSSRYCECKLEEMLATADSEVFAEGKDKTE